MIADRFDPSHRGQPRLDRGPLILKCDGCGKRATPSAVGPKGWRSDLGTKGGVPAVLDLCPACLALLVRDVTDPV